jgi:K+-sensing histidine kinase KdpD
LSADNQTYSVSWENLVRFVRQLSHDLRNDLNALELQSAFVGELAGDNAELKEELKRLREMISKLAITLQGLSAQLTPVSPDKIPYTVSDFLEDLRDRVTKDFPTESKGVTWKIEASGGAFEIDPQLLLAAFAELFRNAFHHGRREGPVSVNAKIDKQQLVITVREPKTKFESAMENWGREPLAKVSQGHYGLGLNRVRTIVEAHGGTLEASYDRRASVLTTTVKVPVSSSGK